MKPKPKSLGQIAYEAHFAKWAKCVACWKEEDPRLHETYERIARAVEREVLRRRRIKEDRENFRF